MGEVNNTKYSAGIKSNILQTGPQSSTWRSKLQIQATFMHLIYIFKSVLIQINCQSYIMYVYTLGSKEPTVYSCVVPLKHNSFIYHEILRDPCYKPGDTKRTN